MAWPAATGGMVLQVENQHNLCVYGCMYSMPAAAYIGALPEADILKELLWLHERQ